MLRFDNMMRKKNPYTPFNNSIIVEQATSRFNFYKKLKRKLLDSIIVACDRLLCPSCDLNINL